MKKLVFIEKEQVLTTSLKVAETFDKPHNDVMKSIRKLISEVVGLGKISQTPMFQESEYIHEQNGQTYPMYLMNRDGFTLLAMGFNGKKALKFKMDYINAFNRMEAKLKEMLAAGKDALWQETRLQTKETYKTLGGVKKNFIAYAKSQGYEDNDAVMYAQLAIKTNLFVGLAKRNDRDNGTIPQLSVLSIIENGMRQILLNGMAEGLHYTQILAKVDVWLDNFRADNFIDSYLSLKLLK